MPVLLQFICYFVAVGCFLLAAFRGDGVPLTVRTRSVGLVALGLAFAFFPALWAAAEAIPK